MILRKKTAVVITDDEGTELKQGDLLVFLSGGKTRLAYYLGLDNRSRAVLKDYLTEEKYACLTGSMAKSKVVNGLAEPRGT